MSDVDPTRPGTSVVTACALDCPDRCSHIATVTADGVTLRGNPDHPYTRGVTCAKIRGYPQRLRSPARITQPWLRRGPRTGGTGASGACSVSAGTTAPNGFEAISWDEAMAVACDALDRARRDDPASILLLRSAGSMGITKSYADYVFGLLGARSTRGSLCDAAGIAAVEADAGALDMNDPREIDAAETVILWGKDPSASSVHVAHQARDARRRGATVVAVSCDTTRVGALADHVVRIRPGTDRFLALAATKILLGLPPRGPAGAPWLDPGRSTDRGAFVSMLESSSLDDLLTACDATRHDAELLAATFAATPKVATIVGWGLQRQPLGGENVRAIHALAFAAGTLGIPGGGLYFSIPSSRHLRPVDELLAEHPGSPPPAAPPLAWSKLAAELDAADPRVRVAWIMCSNIANQGPDATAFARALADVETIIAVEAFWTETACQATLVLPPRLWLEEEDATGTCWRNELAPLRRLAGPPPGVRTDFELLTEVARRLDLKSPYDTPDRWLAARVRGGAAALEEMRRDGWLTIDHPPVAWAEGFAHADRRFHIMTSVSPEPAAAVGFPLRLLTVVRTEQLHSQLPHGLLSSPRACDEVPGRVPGGMPRRVPVRLPVRLHPSTAAALGLADGDPARVVSPAGTLHCSVTLDGGLHPDAAACPRGGWISHGEGVNEATEAIIADMGETAAFYATHVRVEPET